MDSLGRTYSIVSMLLATLVFAGCTGKQLRPAPEAQLVPGKDNVAVAQNDGVRMTVEPNAWFGRPRTLDEEMVPLRVTIENRSDQPLRIRYNELQLQMPSGLSLRALPPMKIEGTARVTADHPVIVPRFGYSGFYVAPWYSPYYDPFYVGLRPWMYPWTFDRLYYDRYYPSWEVELPTRDMREYAIPEGVIQPGGSVSGFLYFSQLPPDTDRVTFAAHLVNGKDGNGFGKLAVPLVIG